MLLPIFTLDIHEIFDHFAAVSIYQTVSKKFDLSVFLLVCMGDVSIRFAGLLWRDEQA